MDEGFVERVPSFFSWKLDFSALVSTLGVLPPLGTKNPLYKDVSFFFVPSGPRIKRQFACFSPPFLSSFFF